MLLPHRALSSCHLVGGRRGVSVSLAKELLKPTACLRERSRKTKAATEVHGRTEKTFETQHSRSAMKRAVSRVHVFRGRGKWMLQLGCVDGPARAG